MSTGQANGILSSLRRLVLAGAEGGSEDCASDAQLLKRFIEHRDQVAFETMVVRHGPLVWGVCLRMLQHRQDSEDAFQAAFLVLARKAAGIRKRESLASWLYGAAYRAALEAKARRSREKQVSNMPERAASALSGTCPDLLRLLDAELHRLPQKYREAVILCDLEGKSRKEAARELAVPTGTLSGRLTTARRMLAARLSHAGVAVSAAMLESALSETAAASVPVPLIMSTLTAASSVNAGGAAAVSGAVAILTQGVLHAMLVAKLKSVIVSLLAIAVISTGIGYAAHLQTANLGQNAGLAALRAPKLVLGLPEPESAAKQAAANQKEPPTKEPPRLTLKEAVEMVGDHLKKQRKIIESVEIKLKELTTDDVWKRLGVQVFQITSDVQTYETFVIRDKTVHHIGTGVGGHGVTTLCVADLNRDKRPELVYAYSWGSGTHRSHVAVFDCLADMPREYVAPQTHFDFPDLAVKRIDDQTVEVLVGDAKVGRLVLARTEGVMSASIELDKDIDVAIKRRIRDMKPGQWNDQKSADLCEALFRYQFEHNKAGVQGKAKAYYLTIEGKDPTAEFIDRFRDHDPVVRPGSEIKQDEGLKLRIEALRWIDDDTAEARGGYYHGRLNASGSLFRILRKAGKWVVESENLEWISY